MRGYLCIVAYKKLGSYLRARSERMNITCIICSDLISQSENIYFTRCGHVFHYHCLAQWMERSKSCPQCRNKVTEKCISRVYFNFASTEGIVDDAAALQSKLDNANFQLRQRETDTRDLRDRIKALEDKIKVNEEILQRTEKKLVTKETSILALKDQLEYVKVQNRETERLRSENERLEKSLNTLNGLQNVLNATADEVERMLEGYTDVKTLATFATALKRALMEAEAKKNDSRSKLQAMKTELSGEKSRVAKLQTHMRQLQDRLLAMERKMEMLNKRKMDESSEYDARETPAKIRKSDERADITTVTVHVDPVKTNESFNNLSMNSLVQRIEESNSPYLRLKQGVGGITINTNLLKPSEFAILNPSKRAFSHMNSSQMALACSTKSGQERNNISIFNNKKPLNTSLDMFLEDVERASERLETSYDGLGGHSKPDVFPVPLKRSPVKSCIPKVTAKHRLKNPNPKNKNEIGKFFQKVGQNE